MKTRTRYEMAQRQAEYWYGDKLSADQLQRATKQIFAKMVVNGATIGKKDGKLIVHKNRVTRPLP